MLKSLITYDQSNMMHKAVGSHGVSAKDLASAQRSIKLAKKRILNDFKEGVQGWLGCPDDTVLVREVERIVRLKKNYTTCVVIGIGGSILGTSAMYTALKHTAKGMKLLFIDTVDPDSVSETLKELDLKNTIVNVISKSGDTLETMSVFFYIRDLLLKQFGKKAKDHIVATTIQGHGELRALAEQEGYETFTLPQNISGRFSVMTAVGLFPLACAGINIKKILLGAKITRDHFLNNSNDPISQFAVNQFLADTLHNQHIHILMPYTRRLELFGDWYRQLWAESLGKKVNTNGDIVHVGPSPLAALGPMDQHSQLQLYIEGPNNKTITFIKVATFTSKLRASVSLKALKKLSFLANTSFAEILHAELEGTAEALRRAHRPNGILTIPTISCESIGSLFMFFQLATGVAGSLYNIHTYDQPGVEEGKKLTAMLLSKN